MILLGDGEAEAIEFTNVVINNISISSSVADLEGAQGSPPGGPNFFIFMQFSVKIGRLAPLPGGHPGSATVRETHWSRKPFWTGECQ